MLRVWIGLVIMGTFLLTLVRHGETAENKLKIVQGHTDTKLVEIGIKQAVLVGQRLQDETFTHVFSSDLSRAQETCEIIMNLNKANSAPITLDSRLRERKLGVLEGQSHYNCYTLIKSHQRNLSPGMESKLEVRERAKSFFRELCRTICKKSPHHLSRTSTEQSIRCPCNEPGCRSYCPFPTDQQVGKERRDGLQEPLCNVNDANPRTSNHLKNGAAAVKLESCPDRMKFSLEISSDEEHLGITPDVLQFGRKLHPAGSMDGQPAASDPFHSDSDGFVEDCSSALNRSQKPCASAANEEPGKENDLEESTSSLSDEDGCHLMANVLLVSHGGFLLELINYFFKELKCKGLNETDIRGPPTCATGWDTPRHSIMSNAGLSRFNISLNTQSAKSMSMSCLYLNNREHLSGSETSDSVTPGVSDLVC